ncbi:MAG: EAL domain-containing protein [Pseudohongiellaceae bacterium]
MSFWHFSPHTAELGTPIVGSYNWPLLILSIAIACFAGYTALSIVNRIIASTDRLARAYWLLAGASAMGCGIWAMHFTGMLAFSLPITVRYELGVTLLSVVPAILASGAALYFIAQPELGWWRLQSGALLMALGIGAMHYTGMEGMHIQGIMHYNFVLFCLSIVVAHLLSMAAIYIRFMMSARFSPSKFWVTLVAAIVMGNAVAGMHYTAMAAARFYPGTESALLAGEFSNLSMGTTISGFSILILFLAMLATRIDQRITESELGRRIQESRADTILKTTADGILALDGEGLVLSCNPAAETIFGANYNDIIGKPIGVLVPGFQLPGRSASEVDSESIRNASRDIIEVSGCRTDGSRFPLEMSMNSMPEADSEIVVISLRDMTERHRAREAIRRTEERLRIVAQATTDAIWDWDLIAGSVWWNEGIQTLFGYSIDEVEPDSRSWSKHIYAEDKDRVLNAITTAIQDSAREWTEEYRFVRKDGSIAHVLDRGFVIRDGSGKAIRMVGGMSDVTARKEAEAEIEFLAFYDSLTGLPNRILLQDRLKHALAACARNKEHGSLMFLDLDAFKTLNDTFGHNTGDKFLQKVAKCLEGCVREADTVARLGGDEFVIVLENLGLEADEAAANARLFANKILETFQTPFVLNNNEHYTTPSIGITLFNHRRISVDELLKQADIAMYQSKAEGGNTLRFYDPEMQARISSRVTLEKELREAIGNDEFVLHYQPQVDADKKVFGAEALVRWQHPDRGLVLPLEFIPLTEDTGLIHPLGHWILETACCQLVAWETRPETRDFVLAVNVSAHQFRHPDFVQQVRTVLERTGANPHRLKIELTENVLISQIEDAVAKMSLLKSDGVGFSLDDFGTGYSSLNYLKRLPLEQLKIDKSFVNDIPTNANDAALACMIIALARLLMLTDIAEGVETEEQRQFLVQQGCKGYQGYLFSKPLPIDEFEALLFGDRSRTAVRGRTAVTP